MSRMVFKLRHEPEERLDLSALTPERLAGLDRRSVTDLRIGISKRGATVGDMFRVTGNNVAEIVFEASSPRLDGIGTGMAAGSLRVTGNVGFQTGRGMTGGSLAVEGSALALAASGMGGGRLDIAGDCGDLLGGPLTGEMAGMKGGMVVVRGRCGDRAGDRMRRGLIVVLKKAGDFAGSRMIGGTIAALGEVGRMPGYLMRRGTLVFGHRPEELSPTFVETGSPDLAFAALLDRHLIAIGALKRPLLARAPAKLCGDTAVLGLGEMLFPR